MLDDIITRYLRILSQLDQFNAAMEASEEVGSTHESNDKLLNQLLALSLMLEGLICEVDAAITKYGLTPEPEWLQLSRDAAKICAVLKKMEETL